MFHKVRRQLTLYNLLILSVVMAVIAAFAFIGSPRTNKGNVTEAMWHAALSGKLPKENRKNSRYGGQGKMALIFVSPNGEIVNVDTQLSVPNKIYTELANLILEKDSASGQITYNGQGYIYLRFIHKAGANTQIVLQESISYGQALTSYLSRISPMLLLSILLVFIASFAITARALVPIRKSWERQVQFTADASHELRTPIAVIQANLEVVMDEPEQTVAKKQKWLNHIKAEADRMQKLIEDLLILSRADEGQENLEKSLFNLSETLINTLESLIPYAQSKGIKLKTDIEADISFFGDKEQIKQLLVILVDNAIKHTPSGGEVLVKSQIQNRNLVIKVTDTGEGIAKEHLTKIFDRFYRINKARERESGSSGLGLSIAKWIVEEHRGSIHVESKLGAGSTFTVVLPPK